MLTQAGFFLVSIPFFLVALLFQAHKERPTQFL